MDGVEEKKTSKDLLPSHHHRSDDKSIIEVDTDTLDRIPRSLSTSEPILSAEEILHILTDEKSENRFLSRYDEFTLDFETASSLFFIILTFNAARLVPKTYVSLMIALNQQYPRCMWPEKLRNLMALAALFDLIEAFGLTTTLATLLSFLSAALLTMHIITYFMDKKARDRVTERIFFKTLLQRIQFGLIDFDTSDLNKLFEKNIVRSTLTALKYRYTKWRNLTEGISEFNIKYGKYSLGITAGSALIGVGCLIYDSYQLMYVSGCGFWDIWTDKCNIGGRYDVLITQVDVWAAISIGYSSTYISSFSFYTAYKQLGPRIQRLQKLGDLYYDKIHLPYITRFKLRDTDSDKKAWVYADASWEAMMVPTVMGIMNYALFQALNTANEFAAQLPGCKNIFPKILDILQNRLTTDSRCPSAVWIIIILGFLSDYELGKVLPMILLAKVLIYLFAYLAQRFTPMTKRISVHEAELILNKARTNRKIALAVGALFCLAIGVPLVILGSKQADQAFQTGRFAYQPFDLQTWMEGDWIDGEGSVLDGNMLPDLSNSSFIFDNTTLPIFLHKICPYDDLMPKINETLGELTVSNVLNMTFPDFFTYENGSLFYTWSPPCPNLRIIDDQVNRAFGLDVDCPVFTELGGVTVFTGIYWFIISFAMEYPALTVWLLLTLALLVQCYRYSQAQKENNIEIEEITTHLPQEDKIQNNLIPASLVKSDEVEVKQNGHRVVFPVDKKSQKSSVYKCCSCLFKSASQAATLSPATSHIVSSPAAFSGGSGAFA